MPVIGIAPCTKLPDYEEAVRRAGGTVRVLDPATDRPEEVVASVDGLLLTGGEDVRPTLYGQEPHSTFIPAEEGRDAFELALVREATDADLPLLAICRGIQILNVARGGTLIQDIPDQVSSGISHEVRTSPVTLAHDVDVSPDSLLEWLLADRLAGGHRCTVNSRHHQATARVGAGLRIAATAPDGVVEALEDPSRRFLLGVQWHPENFWRSGEFDPLFKGFVDASAAKPPLP